MALDAAAAEARPPGRQVLGRVWVWVKIKRPQVLVIVSIYQGAIWVSTAISLEDSEPRRFDEGVLRDRGVKGVYRSGLSRWKV